LKRVAVFSFMTAGFLVAAGAFAQTKVLTEPPKDPDPKARYVFYLHGGIIESQGRRPTHRRWGVYEYDAILEALQAKGFIVISEERDPNTSVSKYARKVKAQIRDLIRAEVPFDHITVVGFSKGGSIAQSVAKSSKAPIRYVLMAGCSTTGKGAKFRGDVLSLVEKSDLVVGLCMPLFERSPNIGDYREIIIDIGGGHGAFYRPHDAWMIPTIEWIEASSSP